MQPQHSATLQSPLEIAGFRRFVSFDRRYGQWVGSIPVDTTDTIHVYQL